MLERVVEYQITRNRTFPNVWHVEATDKEGKGEVYSVLFSGPYAKERAEEYVRWKTINFDYPDSDGFNRHG